MIYAFDVEKANTDPQLWHPLVVQRWTQLQPLLERHLGCRTVVNEGYRPNARQAYLFGQGRTAMQLRVKGLDPSLARPGNIVTNAWSAKTSAHGFVLPMCTAYWPEGIPASCALDIIVLGQDDKPWTPDDPWDQFVALTTGTGPLANIGLVHFHAFGKQVWDRPHLQLIEYSDDTHNLLV